MSDRQVPILDGRHIRCRIQNDNAHLPVLILLNGAVFNLDQWKRMVDTGQWTQRFRVIRYDYCDTGLSSARKGGVSIRVLAEELVSFMDALDIPNAHFYAMSQGTVVLQALAAHDPGRILSAAGWGWFHGDYSEREVTRARIQQRVTGLESLKVDWDQPMDRPVFDALWTAVFRKALLNATWDELSYTARIKDWGLRRMLFPLIAPTSVRAIHNWFDYAVRDLASSQGWLRDGFVALGERPALIQHALADQTLDFGMAAELVEQIPGARLVPYGEGYNHVSIAFDKRQARKVVAEHIQFLDESGSLV